MKITHKKVDIFCGTGGVGKTTMATGRALQLALAKKKVLLITIDPAKRLKQILNLTDENMGEVVEVSTNLFIENSNEFFHAMLMSNEKTLDKMAKENNVQEGFKTSIIDTLKRPYSGMNEIMSIIEVQYQLAKEEFDTIILDTPPGLHFIDFLESSEKIKNFFDKSFIDIFNYVGKLNKGPTSLFNKLVASGIDKLLTYLEKVTGKDFVREFIETVLVLYKCRDSFLAALNFQNDLKRPEYSNWFLVTSIEQQKLMEAEELVNLAGQFFHQDNYLIVNKCLRSELDKWSPVTPQLTDLKKYFLEKENMSYKQMATKFDKVLLFDDILTNKQTIHVRELAMAFNQWCEK